MLFIVSMSERGAFASIKGLQLETRKAIFNNLYYMR